MARVSKNEDYGGRRTAYEDENARLFDNASMVVDSVLRDFDTLSEFDYDEEL